MLVIGIAGGVASGKSLIAEQLRQLGAEVLDADSIAHEVLLEDEVKKSVRRRWGESVFNTDGSINRSAVAKIVFAASADGPEQLAFLESITHPRIGERLRHRVAELAAGDKVPALVLDAAVMFKAGWDRICDNIVFVDAPRAARLARALNRGWTEEQFAAREAAQESLDEKRRRANWVIDNSGSPEQTLAQVRQFWDSRVQPADS